MKMRIPVVSASRVGTLESVIAGLVTALDTAKRDCHQDCGWVQYQTVSEAICECGAIEHRRAIDVQIAKAREEMGR